MRTPLSVILGRLVWKGLPWALPLFPLGCAPQTSAVSDAAEIGLLQDAGGAGPSQGEDRWDALFADALTVDDGGLCVGGWGENSGCVDIYYRLSLPEHLAAYEACARSGGWRGPRKGDAGADACLPLCEAFRFNKTYSSEFTICEPACAPDGTPGIHLAIPAICQPGRRPAGFRDPIAGPAADPVAAGSSGCKRPAPEQRRRSPRRRTIGAC